MVLATVALAAGAQLGRHALSLGLGAGPRPARRSAGLCGAVRRGVSRPRPSRSCRSSVLLNPVVARGTARRLLRHRHLDRPVGLRADLFRDGRSGCRPAVGPGADPADGRRGHRRDHLRPADGAASRHYKRPADRRPVVAVAGLSRSSRCVPAACRLARSRSLLGADRRRHRHRAAGHHRGDPERRARCTSSAPRPASMNFFRSLGGAIVVAAVRRHPPGRGGRRGGLRIEDLPGAVGRRGRRPRWRVRLALRLGRARPLARARLPARHGGAAAAERQRPGTGGCGGRGVARASAGIDRRRRRNRWSSFGTRLLESRSNATRRPSGVTVTAPARWPLGPLPWIPCVPRFTRSVVPVTRWCTRRRWPGSCRQGQGRGSRREGDVTAIPRDRARIAVAVWPGCRSAQRYALGGPVLQVMTRRRAPRWCGP